MKKLSYKIRAALFSGFLPLLLVCLHGGMAQAQDDSLEVPAVQKHKLVKNTFEGVWLADNQTVIVPDKGTLEMDIQHRFGTVDKGRKDVWGLFAPSNIRLGISYAPINRLFVGAGLTKERTQIDFNAKYALLNQAKGGMPVSLTWFGNVVIDGREKSNFRKQDHRLSYFNQLIMARKVTDRFSVQVSPSLSWYNNVEAYVDTKGEIQKKMKNEHLAISALGRYKITNQLSFILGYDQPITQHYMNNPDPNIVFGIDITTSSHAFQVFAGNYYSIVPQSNNVFNQNDYREGQFLVGFNITRLWSF